MRLSLRNCVAELARLLWRRWRPIPVPIRVVIGGESADPIPQRRKEEMMMKKLSRRVFLGVGPLAARDIGGRGRARRCRVRFSARAAQRPIRPWSARGSRSRCLMNCTRTRWCRSPTSTTDRRQSRSRWTSLPQWRRAGGTKPSSSTLPALRRTRRTCPAPISRNGPHRPCERESLILRRSKAMDRDANSTRRRSCQP